MRSVLLRGDAEQLEGTIDGGSSIAVVVLAGCAKDENKQNSIRYKQNIIARIKVTPIP